MQLNNSENHFGLIAILFHWLMTILIIAMLILGLYMIDLPKGIQKLKLYGWHKEIGMAILMLVVLRLAWRLVSIAPILSLPWWERFSARLVHWLLYIFMIALPLSGWVMSSAAGVKFSFFGLFVVPSIVSPNLYLKALAHSAHEVLAYALIGIIILHTLAALKHHFVDRDDILRRMIS